MSTISLAAPPKSPPPPTTSPTAKRTFQVTFTVDSQGLAELIDCSEFVHTGVGPKGGFLKKISPVLLDRLIKD